MQINYLEHKSRRKESSKKAFWLVAVMVFLFGVTIFRFATSSVNMTSPGLPTNDDAYDVAKDFIADAMKTNDVDFPGNGYQVAKRSDSVYVIRSVVETTNMMGFKNDNNFRVLMQYNGGKQNEKRNWSLLQISGN